MDTEVLSIYYDNGPQSNVENSVNKEVQQSSVAKGRTRFYV